MIENHDSELQLKSLVSVQLTAHGFYSLVFMAREFNLEALKVKFMRLNCD